MATLNRWDVGLAGRVEVYLKPEDGMFSVRLHIAPCLDLTDVSKDNTGEAREGLGRLVRDGNPDGHEVSRRGAAPMSAGYAGLALGAFFIDIANALIIQFLLDLI